MRSLFALMLLPTFLLSLNASALLITDTYVVEKQIPAQTGVGHIFELFDVGYSPATDSITNIRLIYDFTEIYSPTNEGDMDQYEEGHTEDDPNYEDEFVIFSSFIFHWREVYPDIDTGLTVFETDWMYHDWCQYTTNAVPDDETAYCLFNIDLAGNMNAYVTSYTDNLWLHSISVEIEVDRTIVPEPNVILLLIVGLSLISFLRNHKA